MDPERRRATRHFMAWLGPRHYALVSDLVHVELRETRDEGLRRQVERKYVRASKKTVPTTGRVREIAWALVAAGCVTENHLADAFHIAYSIRGGADALVTWNLQDLAREHTRRILRDYCWEHGHPELRVGTPVEVGRWLGVKIR
jgi:transposase InsO family protein